MRVTLELLAIGTDELPACRTQEALLQLVHALASPEGSRQEIKAMYRQGVPGFGTLPLCHIVLIA